jgi:hypothetical protein
MEDREVTDFDKEIDLLEFYTLAEKYGFGNTESECQCSSKCKNCSCK